MKYRRRKITEFISYGVTVSVLYLPWLLVVLKQTGRVSQGWWVQQISYVDIGSYIKYIFGNSWILLFFLITYLLYIKSAGIMHSYLALGAPLVITFVIVIGMIISLALRPVFVIRYAFPCIIVMWLGFCVVAGKLKQEKVKIILWLCTIVISIYNIVPLTQKEIETSYQAKETRNYLLNIKKESAIIGGCGDLVMINALYEFDVYNFPLQKSQPAVDKLQEYVFGMETIYTVTDINNLFPRYKEVYLLGSTWITDELLIEFINEGGSIVHEKELWLNRWIDWYKLELPREEI